MAMYGVGGPHTSLTGMSDSGKVSRDTSLIEDSTDENSSDDEETEDTTIEGINKVTIEDREVSSDESFEELVFSPEEVVFDERRAAFEGVKLILSGTKLSAAESHFQSFRMYSAPMSSGFCFVHLIRAMLSQDAEDVARTKAVVKASEKLFKQIRKSKHSSEYTRLYTSVCHADAYLFKAFLLMVKFEFSVALQIGWFIRKAAKLFRSNEHDLRKLKPSLTEEEFKNLNSAVAFGVGFTNLALSILPPSYASLMNVMGYENDRVKGLKNLDVCRQGTDLHSPLASVVLLWYYLLAKPLMCVNPDDLELGFAVAEELLDESTNKLGENSWVFCFFKGKLSFLRLNVDDALQLYTEARDRCGEDFEKVKALLVFEIGWCWVIKCDFQKSLEYFSIIKDCSYWSEGLYPYVTALDLCVMGDFKQGLMMLKKIAMIKKKHVNNTEYYVISRAKLAYNTEVKNSDSSHFKLFFLEMLYLWNHLALIAPEDRAEAIKTVSRFDKFERKLKPCAYLICGALQTASGQFLSAVETLETLKSYLTTQKSSFSMEKCYGLYELALAKYKLMSRSGRVSAVDMVELEAILDKSVQLNGYQFENRLKLRVHSLRSDICALDSSSSNNQSENVSNS